MDGIDGIAEPERFVSRREMAGILGVSIATLDRMVAANEIPSVTWGRRTRRFRPSAVIARLSIQSAPDQTEDAA